MCITFFQKMNLQVEPIPFQAKEKRARRQLQFIYVIISVLNNKINEYQPALNTNLVKSLPWFGLMYHQSLLDRTKERISSYLLKYELPLRAFSGRKNVGNFKDKPNYFANTNQKRPRNIYLQQFLIHGNLVFYANMWYNQVSELKCITCPM